MSFNSDTICKDKLDYLTNLIEIRNYSEDSVKKISTAMSYVTKWQLGVIYQRKL